AAVAGALHHLPEPTAGLRGVQAVRIGRRSLHVINLKTGEMRPIDFPFGALPVGLQNECAFARSHQHSRLAHRLLLVTNFGISGVESRSRQRRRVSASTCSRFFSSLAASPGGARVSSCRAPQMSISNRTGARSIPFSVSL